jgi:phenylalanyl-tRNA synthetase alpha chain
MKTKLADLKNRFLQELSAITDYGALKEFELRYLSRKGELAQLLAGLKDLDLTARREIGEAANKIKIELQAEFQKAVKNLEAPDINLNSDVTLPGRKQLLGHLHPITQIQREIEDIFSSLGFMILDGPELESDYYNFEALNVPPNHPARDMQDTFYIDAKNKAGDYDMLMRTQTSNVQVRAMRQYGAPLKAIIPGRVFRSESTDARHEHTFYQLEGLLVDKEVNFGQLRSLMELVGQKLYGADTKLRMRPKFYPFVEPGSNGEYTCFLCHGQGCKVCKGSGWLEIVGCGLIHPKVLLAGGIDPNEYSGLAFGFGLSRLAMLKYGITDIRLFLNGDKRFLDQF